MFNATKQKDMNTNKMIRRGLTVMTLWLTLVPANAHRRHVTRGVIHPIARTHIMARPVVYTRPAVTMRITNRLSTKDRLNMALAYLHRNQYLTAKEYAKLTGLDKKMAEAELNAFSMDKKNRIAIQTIDKKTLYTLKG